MRRLAVLLIASACDQPSSYAPLTADTSIEVSEGVVSGIVRPFSRDIYITVLGDGTVQYIHAEDGTETSTGRLPRDKVQHVLNELASIDFFSLECRDGFHVNHGSFGSLTLTAPGKTNHVRLDECSGGNAKVVTAVVSELETLAFQVTSSAAPAPR